MFVCFGLEFVANFKDDLKVVKRNDVLNERQFNHISLRLFFRTRG